VSIRVATAAADAVAESAIVQALMQASGAQLVRRCRDVVELRAVAVTTDIDVAVVDGRLRGLDRDVVDELAGHGVRCVVVSDLSEADLLSTGVAAVVGRDLGDLTAALTSAPLSVVRSPIATPIPGPSVDDRSAGEVGRLLVVWGPPGSPGRSTVAIELTAALCGVRGGWAGRRRPDAPQARRPQDCLLIDLDTVAPSIAQQLGLIDDTSGVAAAARAASRGRVTDEQLAALAVSVPSGPRVLTGLPLSERWTELRPAAVQAVLASARSAFPWTVVDAGFGIEGDDLDWVDPAVPQRYGAARAALTDADVVLCVGLADPIGVVRLLRHLPQVRDLAPTADVRVVINRGADRAAVALLKEAGATPLTVLPDDPRSVGEAVARGGAVGELAAGSRFAAAVDALAASLISDTYDQPGERAAGTHRRLLRSAHRRHRRRDARVV
jgi:MinD-like ATPase involved in chromosome partitioning or flagellar assembly